VLYWAFNVLRTRLLGTAIYTELSKNHAAHYTGHMPLWNAERPGTAWQWHYTWLHG